jgi:hypothetical protein
MNMYCGEHGTLDFCPYCIEQNSPESKIKEAAPALLEALEGIISIVNDSRGVAGYHLNGNTALWEEFNEIDAAIAAIAAAKGEV